jgi:hypothetical protein
MVDAAIGIGALLLGFASALATMQPPVPVEHTRAAYLELRATKITSAGLSASLVVVCLLALTALWGVVAGTPTGDPRTDRLFLLAAGLITALSGATAAGVLVRYREFARRLRPSWWRQPGPARPTDRTTAGS